MGKSRFQLWVHETQLILVLFINFCIIFFFKRFYLFILQRGREGERERNISVCARPLLGTWPATQACTLTGNQTGDPDSQAGTQATESYQLGQIIVLFSIPTIINSLVPVPYIIINHETCYKGKVQVPQWFLIKPPMDCLYLCTLCYILSPCSLSRTFCLTSASSTWWTPIIAAGPAQMSVS